jgi:4'-phosphopantetheinyl transferase
MVSRFAGTHFAKLMLQRPGGWTGLAHICWSSVPLEILDRCKDQFLSLAESRLATDLKFDRRRRTFLLGRYCAKESLAALLHRRDFTSIDVIPGVFAQPVVLNSGSRASVSISHTDDSAAALAFDSTHPMGLDIECLDEEKASAVEAQLTAKEKIMVASLSQNRSEARFVSWAMKEALSKVLLTGLMTPLPIYEIATMVTEDDVWRATFRNFGQYQAVALLVRRHVVALALPKNTQIQISMLDSCVSSDPNPLSSSAACHSF